MLKKIMALALVALWSLASNHCKLEQLTTLDVLQCCATETVNAHPEPGCEADGCASLEESFYKTEEQPTLAQAPVMTAIFAAALVSELLPPPPTIVSAPAASPRELSARWLFVSRTAASPRAPSLAS